MLSGGMSQVMCILLTLVHPLKYITLRTVHRALVIQTVK
jgi:hypothetical protein